MKGPSLAFWRGWMRTVRGAVFVLVPTGNPPSLRFGHPDVTFGRHRPSAHQSTRGGAPCFPDAPSGCQPGRSPQRSKERAERPGDGCPCVGAEETCGVPSQLAKRERTPPLQVPIRGQVPPSEPVSCRSYPAAHSREHEPNAPRSAQLPASGQRRRQPRRCRCAPPARAPPNRQCR